MTTTYVSPVAGEEYLIEVGNGDGPPETFSTHAVINTDRGIDFSAATSTNEVQRVDTPGAPAKIVRLVKSTDCKITGAGMIDTNDTLFWMNWLQSGAAKNIKFGPTARTGANGGWTGAGPFFLTAFAITGKQHEESTCTLTLEQADLVTLTANA